MIVKNYKDVKEEVVTIADSKQTTIRWLITDKDGAINFATRRIKIDPGGEIGLHEHPEEHHIYVLEGKAKLLGPSGVGDSIHEGDVLFIPPHEIHGFLNDFAEPFIFICIISYL